MIPSYRECYWLVESLMHLNSHKIITLKCWSELMLWFFQTIFGASLCFLLCTSLREQNFALRFDKLKVLFHLVESYYYMVPKELLCCEVLHCSLSYPHCREKEPLKLDSGEQFKITQWNHSGQHLKGFSSRREWGTYDNFGVCNFITE